MRGRAVSKFVHGIAMNTYFSYRRIVAVQQRCFFSHPNLQDFETTGVRIVFDHVVKRQLPESIVND